MSANRKDKDLDFEDDDDLATGALSADDIELEIEDTTPAADRGRPVAADSTTDDDDLDDLDDYGDKVKARINREVAKRHDERRAKEAAVRERDAAVTFARDAASRLAQIQDQLNTTNVAALAATKGQAETTVSTLKAKLKEALELGESEKAAELTVELGAATAQLQEVVRTEAHYKANPQQQQQPQQQQRPQAPRPSSRTEKWVSDNQWFNTNTEMRALAMGVHQRLVESGVAPDTDQYYNTIDQVMRKRFPEEFSNNSTSRESNPPVAGVTRRPAGGGKTRVKLTADEAAVARRLGVSEKEYARQKLMLRSQ